MDLIDNLISEGYLKTSKIIAAFRAIKRIDFLPEDMQDLAEANTALPIGQGQTISQPLVVAFMLEQLQPEPGDKILDIGAGSGWTTALLAHNVSQKGISKQKGRVTAMEIVPELKEFGEKNVAKYNFIKKEIVKFICADGTKGYKKESPFDRILVSAAAERMPFKLKEQLRLGGRLVLPINNSIWTIERKSAKEFIEREYHGFVFVPLITNN